MFGGRPAHWLSTWKLVLPHLNELRRLSQVLCLLTLAVRNANRQAVRGFGRGLKGFTQRANSVIDVAFGPGVLVRDALWAATYSCISMALRLISNVRCSSFFASTQISS